MIYAAVGVTMLICGFVLGWLARRHRSRAEVELARQQVIDFADHYHALEQRLLNPTDSLPSILETADTNGESNGSAQQGR